MPNRVLSLLKLHMQQKINKNSDLSSYNCELMPKRRDTRSRYNGKPSDIQ